MAESQQPPFQKNHELSLIRFSEQHLRETRQANMSAPQANEAEKNIEIWKVKKLIKRLEAARGNGTSMISLIIRKWSS